MIVNTEIIAGRTFTKSDDGYIFPYSKFHAIVVSPVKGESDSWEAKEIRISKTGKFADGTREIKVLDRVCGPTPEEAVIRLYELSEAM